MTLDWKRLVRDRLRVPAHDGPRGDEVVEEIAEHLAQRYEEKRASGLADAAARAETIAELDEPDILARAVRRDPRPARVPGPIPPPTSSPSRLLADLGRDIRHAARLLHRAPGFTTAAVLMLAVGIGGTTALFSVVDAVLLKPLPYPAADRLVAVWETDRDSGTVREPAAVPDFIDWMREARSFETLGGLIATEVNLTPVDAEPLRVAAVYVTRELLPMLGAAPVEGRLFTDREHETGEAPVVVLSERLRRRLFGAHVPPGSVRIDDEPRAVVGVVRDDSDTGLLQWLLAADYARGWADRDARSRVDIWMPLPLDPQRLPRSTHPLLVLGRLAPGVPSTAAQGEMSSVMAALEHAYPDDNRARGAHVEPFTGIVLSPVRPALWALLLAVTLVLVSACVNVANLLLARGAGRAREVAVRTALGAAPLRLTRQFIVENALLAGLAAACGLILSAAGLRVLVALAPADVPRLVNVTLDTRVLAISLLVAVTVAILFGLLPVLQARRLDVQRALAADTARSVGGGPGRERLRAALVVTEVALAMVLTVGAGLMVRSLWQIQRTDPGFRASGVLKAEFQLPPSRYPRDFRRFPDFAEMHRFNAALLEEVRGLPGVEGAALAGNHPLDTGFTNSFTIVGRETEGRDWPEIAVRRVTPDYFTVLRVPLVSGRYLSPSDITDGTPVVTINEAAARRFFGDRNPLGQQIAYWGAARTIVGVVGDERIHGVTEAAPPAVYAPLSQNPSANGAEALLVRTARPDALAGAIRAAIARHDPALAVFGVEPLERTLAESIGQQRFVMRLLIVFACVALLLAAAGIHAVLSYDVAQRKREIGIRLALGALPGAITGWIVRRGAVLVGIGLAIGAVGSAGLVRLIRALLFNVSPADPATFGLVAVLLGLVGLCASWLPAARAVRAEPLAALRDE